MSAEEPLHARVVAGDVRALARVLRLVDDAVGEYRAILKALFPHTGRAWTVGVTGTPGAGKSTLTDKLIAAFRADDHKVGVLAIDPTSPYTGGAILGDRIRMQRHSGDERVFIRSLATRGALGGLSRSAADMARVMDAWGADVVLIETVGVGQDELEVTRTADTTLVVMAPGMGDEVQALKAGILECADVFAVNKADRDGADATMRDIELMISLGDAQRRPPVAPAGHGGHHGVGPDGKCGAPVTVASGAVDGVWRPPVLSCIATVGRGTAEIVEALGRHRAWLRDTEEGRARSLRRLREAMHNQLRNALIDHATASMGALIDSAVERVARRQIDPYSASEELVAAFQQR